MFRVLIFLLGLVVLALGIAWFADRPGEIVVNWQGYRIVTSFSVGLAFLFFIAALLTIAWGFSAIWLVYQVSFQPPHGATGKIKVMPHYPAV